MDNCFLRMLLRTVRYQVPNFHLFMGRLIPFFSSARVMHRAFSRSRAFLLVFVLVADRCGTRRVSSATRRCTGRWRPRVSSSNVTSSSRRLSTSRDRAVTIAKERSRETEVYIFCFNRQVEDAHIEHEWRVSLATRNAAKRTRDECQLGCDRPFSCKHAEFQRAFKRGVGRSMAPLSLEPRAAS